MTTQEVANRYHELSQTGQWDKVQDELFAEGMASSKEKGKRFNEMVEEMHGGYATAPVVGGKFFSVGMGVDCTMKGMGRQKMDEIALYEVKDGKIVREQFFY